MSPPAPTHPGLVRVVLSRAGLRREDELIVEEPLEIRVDDRSVGVLMRTPGDDLDLVAGFLRTEGIIEALDDLAALDHCRSPAPENAGNIVLARLAPGTRPLAGALSDAGRGLIAASGCGLCGKTTIEAVRRAVPIRSGPQAAPPDAERAARLTARLRDHQGLFARTGGCHGAAIFGADDAPLVVREDVGRHNAVDKCIGALLRAGLEPPNDAVLVVSGRAGYELVQKAAMAGIGALVAVGAASSLADALARQVGLHLQSFVRPGGGNLHG